MEKKIGTVPNSHIFLWTAIVFIKFLNNGKRYAYTAHIACRCRCSSKGDRATYGWLLGGVGMVLEMGPRNLNTISLRAALLRLTTI